MGIQRWTVIALPRAARLSPCGLGVFVCSYITWRVQDFYPVHAAVLRRDVPAVTEALSYGVRFTKQDSEGNLPLHCAVAANDAEIVKLLLAAGAPINLPNKRGRTAMQVAMLMVCFQPSTLKTRCLGLCNDQSPVSQLLAHWSSACLTVMRRACVAWE